MSNTQSDKTTFPSVHFDRQFKTVFDLYKRGKWHFIQLTGPSNYINQVLTEWRESQSLSIRTVCMDRKGRFPSVYGR